MIKAEPQPPMIKPEPVEGRILNRKRSGTLSTLQEIPPKKIKANPESPSIAGVDAKRPPLMSAEAIRGELLDLQREINHLQPQLDRSRRKSEKATSQLTRELNITNQLIALHQRRKGLTEMLPAVSAPVHPVAGPSFQNGSINGSAHPRQLFTLAQTSATSATVASGSNIPTNWVKDESMDTDSDGDDATLPPTSDMDPFRSLADDDNNRMLVDGTNPSVDFYQYNTAKADE